MSSPGIRSRPAFCPNASCNSRTKSIPWRYKKKGFYVREQKPRRIQRYLCQHCGRNFSSQTFAVSYWLRHGHLLEPLFKRLVSCSGLRQIAREMEVSHSTVQRLTERLGRHCLLFHERMRPRAAPSEPLVLDGFRTFEHSQYWPMDLNLLVGVSHYVYGFNDAELRRSGAMRLPQRRKRARLEKRHGRPDPQATRRSVQELLRRIVPPGSTAVIRSDEHRAYQQAMRRLRDRTFHHEATPSTAARTTHNPLFPVNLADLLLRHCSANHKRETIAFSKRRQGVLYRAAIWVVWKNYLKSLSENRRDAPPAKELGLIARALTVREVLAKRLFPDPEHVSRWIEACYFARIPTRAMPSSRVHQAKYAI